MYIDTQKESNKKNIANNIFLKAIEKVNAIKKKTGN